MAEKGLARIVEALRAHRFAHVDEDELHSGIADVLRAIDLEPVLEHRLAPRDRIDLLVERVGIEVKVDGSASSVERQLERYAESDELDALILVSSRRHHLAMPSVLNGKPVVVVSLMDGALR